jgi:ABC-2 type transport system ATP-binding protein
VAVPLAVHGLSRSFGELEALQRFELELAGGECVAVLGRNGSGKTTAVRLIAGLLEPSEGLVEICGARIDREPSAVEARAALAVVPDSPALYPDLTVGDAVRDRHELEVLTRGRAGCARSSRSRVR